MKLTLELLELAAIFLTVFALVPGIALLAGWLVGKALGAA